MAAITVENLGKAYRLGLKEEMPDTLVGAVKSLVGNPLAGFHRLRRLDTFSETEESDDILWALRDVSFEVEEGEVVGIIGRNGAGKSTLLKILSRITEPTHGRAVIRGRVSSLLEVGTGFHPELTGRENIYMNGTVLGMRKREIDRKFDEMVDFSGVEKFLDTPIKRYSSGMQVRLAFAVAAHLEPEILIIDEVLAVGDAEFQKKCLGKMQDVANDGRTVLFVSHNMSAITTLCSKAISLSQGRLIGIGEPCKEIAKYLQAAPSASISTRTDRSGTGDARLIDATLRGSHGEVAEEFATGDPIEVVLTIQSRASFPNTTLYIAVYSPEGTPVTFISSALTHDTISVSPGIQTVSCQIEALPLSPGTYYVNVALSDGAQELDHVVSVLSLTLHGNAYYRSGRTPPRAYGPLLCKYAWKANPIHAR